MDALNGPIASALGAFTMAIVAGVYGDVAGGRTGMLLGVVVFGVGALLLRPVHEPRHATGQPGAGQPMPA